jgi:ATP-binding cassette subfamily C (CFTR/MRP) protein 1
MAITDCLNDDGFGPAVKGCRNDFDFTITFELIMFSLVPNSLFVLLALFRSLKLYKRKRIVHAKYLLTAKLVSNSFRILSYQGANSVQVILFAFIAL